MAETLESLEIEVKHSASHAATEIDRVASAVKNLGKSIEGSLGSLTKFADTLGKIGKVNISGARSAASKTKFATPVSNDLQAQISSARKFDVEVHKVAKSAEDMEAAFRGGDVEGAWKARERALTAYNAAQREAAKVTKEVERAEKEAEKEKQRSEREAARVAKEMAREDARAEKEAAKNRQQFEKDAAKTAAQAAKKAQEQAAERSRIADMNARANLVTPQMREQIQGASEIDILRSKLADLKTAQEEALNQGDTSKAMAYQSQIIKTASALDRTKKAAEEAAKGVKKLGDAAKKSHNPLENFISSLKRIAFYRFIRSIIKGITEAFQEGLQKAYTFSAGVEGEGHRFADAMDSMKSSSNQMKGQLGSAFISLLTAIQPIVEAIISLVVKLADALSQLFAAFTGKTYLKANTTAAKFADTMKSGAGAAKEWKNQLLGFDEINRLNEPSNGGGGGGANPLEGFSFEDTPIGEFWLKVAEKVKEFYDKIKPIIDDVKLIFSGLIDFITGVFTGDWDLAFQGLGKIVEGFGNLIQHTTELVVSLFDELAENGILSISKLFDFLEEKTGLDLSKMQYQVVFVLNFIRLLVEEISLDIAGRIQALCDTVSKALNGDWAGAWESAQNITGKSAFQIVSDVYKAAKETTDQMVMTDHAVSEHSNSSARSVAGASQSISNSMAVAGDGSATMAEVIGANMQSVSDSLAQAAQNSISINDNGNTLSFTARIQNIAVRIARALGGGMVGGALGGIAGFASGGFPDEGQLFIANEAGAEMVGSIGGRTAVANNDQIVEGIRQGVYEAVMAANSNGNNSFDVRVFLDSREIKTGQQRLARAMG